MKDLRSRFGDLWIAQDSTTIDALTVTETAANTVQISIGIRNFRNDGHMVNPVSMLDEIVVELDPVAAGELAKQLEQAVLPALLKSRAGVSP